MRPKQIINLIEDLYPLRRTVCIEGPPGVGKTTILNDVKVAMSKSLGEDFGLIMVYGPNMLVDDMGIPDLLGNTTDTFGYKLPKWYPAASRTDIPERGILCIDERNQCGPDLQKIFGDVCQARSLRGVPMKEGWTVVVTGNRIEDRAGAQRILSHVRNRETIITFDVSLDDWCDWAYQNNVHEAVIAWNRFKRGAVLHDFDPNREANPTPRSWVEGVSNLIDKIPKELELEAFGGSISEGHAAEFVGFMKIMRNLPSIEGIILNPTTADIPKDAATRYAVAGSLAQASTENNFDAIMQYTDRMDKDLDVFCVQAAAKRDPELQNTAAFARWATNNSGILF